MRILDWGHSTGYVAAVGQAVFGAGTTAFQQWFDRQLHELKHGDSEKVLGKLRGLRDELAIQTVDGKESEVLKTVRDSLGYLQKRREQIHYAEFCAAGYPIGSGIVESGNKLVVEARMKGAGMHWERAHVDGMVALRNVVCSDRWEEAWPQISAQMREAAKARSAMRRDERRPILAASIPVPEVAAVAAGTDLQTAMPIAPPPVVAAIEDKSVTRPRRPAANHPWRRMTVGRHAWAPPRQAPSAKT